jgi:hypothetical protein
MTGLFEHGAKPLLKFGAIAEPGERITHGTVLQVAGAFDIERYIMKHDDHAAHHARRLQYGRDDVAFRSLTMTASPLCSSAWARSRALGSDRSFSAR